MRFQLSENKFKPFILIITIGLTVLILWFTISYRSNQLSEFHKNVQNSDSLNYYRVYDYKSDTEWSGKSILGNKKIVFIAAWSDKSIKVLSTLVPDSSYVIALVKDDIAYLTQKIDTSKFKYIVNGTKIYQNWSIPGLPTMLSTDSQRIVRHIFVGENEILKAL